MKKFNRVLSMLLSVLTVLSTLAIFTVIPVSADSSSGPTTEKEIQDAYLKTVFHSPEDKLESMELMRSEYGYELYVDAISGEVGVKNVKTGDILLSNPYDVASSVGSNSTKMQILSQIVIQYSDNGTMKTLSSFEEAAMRGQIKVYPQKKNVRVEYTIGREESRKLVPHWIPKDRYEELLLQPMQDAITRGELESFTFQHNFSSFYELIDITDPKYSSREITRLIAAYPICEEMPIYVYFLEETATNYNKVENMIKTYCEDYTFEAMDADHEKTGYEAKDEQFPVFKLALEYSLTKDGLTVRLPCNGLRYDMSKYTLESISILPYMGAGNSKNSGYNFYPDGAGSLFDYEQLKGGSKTVVRGKVYGLDYAYHEITGATYQKAIRYPVYGSVSNECFYNYTYSYKLDKEVKTETVRISNTVMSKEQILEDLEKKDATLKTEIVSETYSRGYLAVIEEGDSLAEVATFHAGSESDYSTMMNYFNPKPKDSYDIADSISVASSSTWTVVSDRKYTGALSIHYIMLTDPEKGEDLHQKDSSYVYYDASWMGMAEAYRDYLVLDGALKKLDLSDVEEEYIPLYLEVFGAMETQQTFLTIPVDVMTPLTTFEDIKTIYNELSAEGNGIKNVNFKMTGFANGGMYYTVPSSVKWEKAVGGKNGFKQLIETAKSVNATGDGSHLGLFPDFDFAYIQQQKPFDGVILKKDAVKTIDNRYTSLRQYSATQQDYVSFYQLAISPSRYEKFYSKFLKKYGKYDMDTLSVASLGTALNSDFDEDEPFNREDDKEYTMEALKAISEKYSLMSEGANAYSWRYLDYILDVDLESSRYVKSAASVPFIGVVLHGYKNFAGTPINEEGDTDHAMLRSIENGAALYFILSYQNTDGLKNDSKLSQYYSVQYGIWKDDVIKYYNELNDQLKDVQTKEIINHEFLVGKRILDMDELIQDIETKILNAEIEEENRRLDMETEKIVAVAEAWSRSRQAFDSAKALVEELNALNEQISEDMENVNAAVAESEFAGENGKIEKALYEISQSGGSTNDNLKNAIKEAGIVIDTLKTLAVQTGADYERVKALYAQANRILDDLDEAIEVIENADTLDASIKTNRVEKISGFKANIIAYYSEQKLDALLNTHKDSFDRAVVAVLDAQNQYLLDAGTTFPAYTSELPILIDELEDHLFTEAILREEATAKNNDEDNDEDEAETVDRYLVDNYQIVAVTYGDRDVTTHDKTAYKTFLLNFNNFAVKVDYTINGKAVTYTIPAGEYVSIMNAEREAN